MRYPELEQTVQNVQSVIDKFSGEHDASIVVNEQIEKLKQCIQTLDPASVNFVKQDIFNKHRIKAYWNKFLQSADALSSIIEGFETYERVLGNAAATFKNKKFSSGVVINNIKREVHITNGIDAETSQQLTAAEQSIQSLDGLIIEYDILLKRVQSIKSACIATFRQAILIAKTQDSFTKINTVEYESNYWAVKLLINRKGADE